MMGHVILLETFLLLVTIGQSQGSQYISACYYTSWSAKTNPAIQLTVSDIDPNLCTHLVYAFANLDLDSLKLVPNEPSLEDSLGGQAGLYAKFNMLKEKNSKLHTILSVGGESAAKSNEFAALANRPDSIAKFAKNAAEFLRKRGFDGLDIDWEYPNITTRTAYTQLLRGVREVFDQEAKEKNKRRLLLTVAVAAGEDRINKGYSIQAITKHVDYIFIMAYDFFGTWSEVTGFNSPLKARASNPAFSPLYNVDHAVTVWLNGGADKHKVIVGMTGAGASFTLNDTEDNAVGATVVKGGGERGPLFDMKGRLIYQEICLHVSVNWKKEWDTEQQVPYAYHDDQWVGYDDTRSIKEKVSYVKDRGLGGVMFWELSFDDPSGQYCNKGKFPLISVIKKGLGLESGENTLTNNVDPGIILLTKASASSIYGATVQTLVSALICVCTLRLIVKL